MNRTELGSCRIIALQGASAPIIQSVLAEIARKFERRGLRVVGVVETFQNRENPCKSMELRSLDDGRRFSISQDLGPGSQACSLNTEGLTLGCAAIEQSIAAGGADIAILSKFGKQEALGGGLIDAFGASIAAGVPILTSVAPALMNQWREFAGDLSECISVNDANFDFWLDQWSNAVTAERVYEIIPRTEFGSPLNGR